MTDINSVVLVGRATRDAELRYTATGTAVLNFSLAVNESRKIDGQRRDEASFFDVNVWGKLGESLKNYIKKGKQVAVAGRLQQQRWESNGEARSRVIVVAESVQLLGGTNNQGAPSGTNGQNGFQEDIPF